ncbi:hypothetical protein [Aquimarina sediminis]|uniref:hypothetical protein n=1 Tax=Aquimarina sediminis TaxID=2070536 RepID=UPI000CA01206|nr:hypothetical protein [Aquimarina sediminis]
MKSNDALLSLLMLQDKVSTGKQPKLITDHCIISPDKIKVKANQIVYLHFLHTNASDFEIEVITATQSLTITPNNTLNGSCNTIFRTVSDIEFRNIKSTDFFIQLLKMQY